MCGFFFNSAAILTKICAYSCLLGLPGILLIAGVVYSRRKVAPVPAGAPSGFWAARLLGVPLRKLMLDWVLGWLLLGALSVFSFGICKKQQPVADRTELVGSYSRKSQQDIREGLTLNPDGSVDHCYLGKKGIAERERGKWYYKPYWEEISLYDFTADDTGPAGPAKGGMSLPVIKYKYGKGKIYLELNPDAPEYYVKQPPGTDVCRWSDR